MVDAVNPGYQKIASNPLAMEKLETAALDTKNNSLSQNDIKEALTGVPGVTEEDVKGFADVAHSKHSDSWHDEGGLFGFVTHLFTGSPVNLTDLVKIRHEQEHGISIHFGLMAPV